jgi:hypothetical protein
MCYDVPTLHGNTLYIAVQIENSQFEVRLSYHFGLAYVWEV